jgi:ribosomal protein L3 glutamine methyltransferase
VGSRNHECRPAHLAGAGAHLNEDGGLLREVGRGRAFLERDFAEKDFLWLDTEASSGEVFLDTCGALQE